MAAVGAHARDITTQQSLGFALERASPFGRMHDLGAHILLIGVGQGERVWIETLDVGNDDDTYFPLLGQEFEQRAGVQPARVGDAVCRLVPARELVRFAVPRLTELLAAADTT